MKNFFANLSHPTKITLITCSSFVILTMLILIFLMLCPIQESSSANNVNDSLVVTVASTEETQKTEEENQADAKPQRQQFLLNLSERPPMPIVSLQKLLLPRKSMAHRQSMKMMIRITTTVHMMTIQTTAISRQ